MIYDEKDENWAIFVDLYNKKIVDTIVNIKFGKDEVWTYGSFKYDQFIPNIIEAIEEYFRRNGTQKTGNLSIHLVYLPFSVEPLHIVSEMTEQQMLELLPLGVDLFSYMSTDIVNELKNQITEKFEKLAYSNGQTYRTFDHLFYNSWKDTIKYTQDIDYLDSNN